LGDKKSMQPVKICCNGPQRFPSPEEFWESRQVQLLLKVAAAARDVNKDSGFKAKDRTKD